MAPPTFGDLKGELALIRREGIVRLRLLDLPALTRLARACGEADPDQVVEAPLIEEVIRRGLDELGGGRLGECALLIFGLEPGTRADSPTQLRREAAERWGLSEARFRRDPQELILTQLADALLRRAHQHQQRMAHLNLERRLPTTSRLAVSWLERFEAYYRVWTPITGLAGDLNAYRFTLIEEGRPYDRVPGTDGPGDLGYSQENQAAGYLTTALWHFTCYLVGVQRHLQRFGGMWLLSDARAEQELADAVYRIGWHSPNNERDDSYLRGLYEQAGGELHPFRVLLETDRIGKATEAEWHEWAAQCRCIWRTEAEVEQEPYPTHRHHAGVDRGCQLHAMVAACNDFCALVDDDWKRVADWYRLPAEAVGMVRESGLYEDWGVRS
ncbi:MAG TPA: hypothetical protein VEW93_06985 [Acidimicrobiales bacterium]|nr:hypothetical protein [Acidimicrobiales bacterium]